MISLRAGILGLEKKTQPRDRLHAEIKPEATQSVTIRIVVKKGCAAGRFESETNLTAEFKPRRQTLRGRGSNAGN